ncbi:hypothetical protein BD414DRAFT_580614 [Trametes punicea]|nr:hypothetical protein BD414DRAFT_580614 [Trametes punicea]
MNELSTSRINRQLRSLRSKCTSLSSLQARPLAPSKPAVLVTYGTSRSSIKRVQDDAETPPLAILQSLDNFGTRLHLDRAIVENMQLSKRIYEVRDAFRNIVQSTIGTAVDHEDNAPRRVLSLAAICARFIGEHVQAEVEAATVEESTKGSGREDDLASKVMNDLYDQVPPAHRHRMFIAHVLTYILEECPHHPTLLNALLEVCLSHGLVAEAHLVLSKLFSVAVGPHPQSTYICPLTHPAHKNFLTTLKETCCASIINDRTFTRILVDAFTESTATRLHVWTSKALTRLARDLRERDFDGSFVSLCFGLASTIAEEWRKRKPASKSGKEVDDGRTRLLEDSLERLAKWVISMLDKLHNSSSGSQDAFRSCVDFLVHTVPLHLHVSDEPPTSPRTCLADALACLAAYCLSSPHATSLHISELSALREILQSVHVKNTTFDGLVSHVFPLPRFVMFAMPLAESDGGDTPTPPPTPFSAHMDGIEALSALAAPLRAHGLLKCEAALWLAALQHIEELISVPTVTQSMTTPGRKLNQSELFNLRLLLMDHLEDAERRCFGGGLSGSIADVPPPATEGEWEWEEMVGSWVLKSPAPARAKRARDGCPTDKRRKVGQAGGSLTVSRSQPREIVAETSSSRAGPPSTQHGSYREPSASRCRGLPVRANVSNQMKGTSSATSSRAPSRTASSDGHSNDEENADPRSAPRPAKAGVEPTRRFSNFATILTDARANVISLRAEREAEARTCSATGTPVQLSRPRTSSVSSPKGLGPPSRRQSSFRTMLADAQRNVISLREERARKEQEAKRYKRRFSQDMISDSEDEKSVHVRKRHRHVHQPESSPMRGAEVMQPSSDDALNLFAYPDSSPVQRY